MKVGIVGIGKVGTAYWNLFDRSPVGYLVYAWDKKWKNSAYGEEFTGEGINRCDLAIVCVPTPPTEDGSCDTSIVEEVVGWLKTPYILIKSTVAPGTTDRLVRVTGKKIAFSPEYVGEGGYFVPYWKYPDPIAVRYHGFMIFGGERKTTNYMVDVFSRVMGPHVTYMQTDAHTAEVVKYMENCWIAMKVTWAQEMSEACERLGVDYREARELWALDGRVEKMHTCAWGGYRGKCLPKDVSAFIRACQRAGYEPELMEAVQEVNERKKGGRRK